MVFLALAGSGFVVGFAVGRWWAVAGALAFAVWFNETAKPALFGGTDMSRSTAATVAGVWVAFGILLGVGIRRLARRSRNAS